ncbi:hypothetical protein KIW84_012879 [Lathyrus oleraceus]|uniref:Uncharacterized protein n=1 Tax=Pisum sativum TaxID=3888 RepID=A0A9D5BIM1_PEA|nr:hypothetical protein KIW84_012879 [Pisum sativum]
MDGNEEDSSSQAIEVYKHEEKCINSCTGDGSVDFYGKPALKARTGRWKGASLLLVNQGLIASAFSGVEANLVLFSKINASPPEPQLTETLPLGSAEFLTNWPNRRGVQKLGAHYMLKKGKLQDCVKAWERLINRIQTRKEVQVFICCVKDSWD